MVARVCLDMLRSRKSRREEPLDAQVSEPIASRKEGIDPEQEALLADSVGLALLVILDTLAPAERLAFVLHDMFAVPFDEIAAIVGAHPDRGPATREPRTPPGARGGSVPTWISAVSVKSSKPTSRPRAAAISTGCWRYSTRTWYCDLTAAPCRGVHPGKSMARGRWPGRRWRNAPGLRKRRW